MDNATTTTAKQKPTALAPNARNGREAGAGIFRNKRVMEEAHKRGLEFGRYRVYLGGKRRARLEFWRDDAVFMFRGSKGERVGNIEGDEKRIIVSVLSATKFEPLKRTLVFDLTGESPKLSRTIRTRKGGSIEMRVY